MYMLQASFVKHQLYFKKPAKTSRNILHEHIVYYVQLYDAVSKKTYYGEAAPLPGLSVDNVANIEVALSAFCNEVNSGCAIHNIDFSEYPSIEFAFETAMHCAAQQQEGLLFDTEFSKGNYAIPINGLVWMNDKDTMLQEALEKAKQGFSTIKFKVGALDFDDECRMIESFRKFYSASKVSIRLDANGAFKPDEALEKLRELSRFTIHSIEQPIKQKQLDWMQEICAKSKIAVALDEELIGISVYESGLKTLQCIKPTFIIIKPTLLGGLKKSAEWVRIAQQLDINWWATSALESNVGLNAIAQWVSTYPIKLPQGLGTGELYTNNVICPLKVKDGKLYNLKDKQWDYNFK